MFPRRAPSVLDTLEPESGMGGTELFGCQALLGWIMDSASPHSSDLPCPSRTRAPLTEIKKLENCAGHNGF